MNLDKLKGHIPDAVIEQLPSTISKPKRSRKPRSGKGKV